MVVAVTSSRVRSAPVKVVIGDGHLCRWVESIDEELATNVLDVVVVNPNFGSAVETDSH